VTEKTTTRRRTNAAASKPKHVADPTEMVWNDVPFFGCPFCGRNGEDRARIQEHIDECTAGGDT
jgi:hypothetical protein